jgi:hypothetical protein
MMFKPGQSGNPKGRAKGSYGGRIQALAVLDRIMAQAPRKKKLAQALIAEFDKNPVHFFKAIIMPLLPKESKMEVDHDGIIEWKSLLGDEPGETPRFDAAGHPIPGVK